MSYESQLQKFHTLGMDAIERLVNDNSELFLSASVEYVAQKIVALTRLRANELPEPQDENEMYQLLADLLGELLASGQIEIAKYGLSVLGANQYNALVNRVASVEVSQAEDPHAIYADVIAIFNGPTSVLNQKMKTEPFRSRFNAAVSAGVI